jgi:hypothetical protein
MVLGNNVSLAVTTNPVLSGGFGIDLNSRSIETTG